MAKFANSKLLHKCNIQVILNKNSDEPEFDSYFYISQKIMEDNTLNYICSDWDIRNHQLKIISKTGKWLKSGINCSTANCNKNYCPLLLSEVIWQTWQVMSNFSGVPVFPSSLRKYLNVVSDTGPRKH